ncbi:MAG: alpha/beta fold hydrolase [Vicinamibacteria bacterium]
MAAFGADVRAVLEALDLRGAVLVGHSMGGPVILEAAKLTPVRVAALVPVDTLVEVERKLTPDEALPLSHRGCALGCECVS